MKIDERASSVRFISDDRWVKFLLPRTKRVEARERIGTGSEMKPEAALKIDDDKQQHMHMSMRKVAP